MPETPPVPTEPEVQELKINAKGELLDSDGNPFIVEGKPIRVSNAQTKEQVNAIVEDRLKRQKDGLQQQIAALEAQANRTPELQGLLENLKTEKEELETKLGKAEETARQEVSEQLSKALKQADTWAAKFKEESAARVRDQLTNAILGASKDHFINPSRDVVPALLAGHKREPKRGPDGQPLDGEHVDLFKVPVKNEQGEYIEEALPLDKAIEAFAAHESNQHYVRSSGVSGSGGGTYKGNHKHLKRSQMNATQKAAFVGEHGLDAYKALAE